MTAPTATPAAAAGRPESVLPPAPERTEESPFKIFRPYLRPYRWLLVVMSISSFLGGLSEAALLVVVARLAVTIGEIDGGLDAALGPVGDVDLSSRELFILALVLVATRAGFQALAAHQSARITQRMMVAIRRDTFDDYNRAGWAVQADESEAVVQDLLGRHANRATTAVSTIAQGMTTAWSLAALVLSAFVVDPIAAALIVVSGVVLAAVVKPLTTLAKRMAVRQQKAGQKFAARAYEAVGLSLEIRAFGVTDQVSNELQEVTESEARPIYFSQLLTRVVGTVYQTAALLILLGVLLVVDLAIDRPLASLGAVVIILVRSLNLAGTLQGVYHTISENGPFAAHLTEERQRFQASVPPTGNETIRERSSLAFDEVSYRYPSGAVGLDRVSFSIDPGEAVGLIGPSGSGKSTLIQVLLRLRHPDDGAYRIGGIDALTVEDETWFDQVSFVPQDCRVIDASISDNIRFFRTEATQQDVEAAARRAHLHDEIMAMAHGYDTALGSRGGALSGGQRQRVAIARALLRQPSILVLDEPTSALDMRSESLVHETFAALKGEVTVVVIAHRLSTLNTCDRIMVMGEGQLQAMGSREELDRSSAFYRDALALSRIRS